jgi:hypothetical protein
MGCEKGPCGSREATNEVTPVSRFRFLGVCQVFCVNDLDFVLGFGFVVALGFAVVVGFGDGVPGKGAFWSAPLD